MAGSAERPNVPILTVFVRNINFSTTEDELRTAFEKFGKTKNVHIAKMRNDRSGELVSRGFAFIDFETPEGIKVALDHKDPIIVDERELFIRAARPGQKRDTIFIVGIPKDTTDEQIRLAFQDYNPTRVRIVTFNEGTRKGYGFVTFDTEEHERAVVKAFRSVTINGSEVLVRFVRKRRDFDRFHARQRGGFRRGVRRAPRGDRERVEAPRERRQFRGGMRPSRFFWRPGGGPS